MSEINLFKQINRNAQQTDIISDREFEMENNNEWYGMHGT